MAADISPGNEQFIQAEIANGTFGSREEAIEAGIDMLKRHRRLVDRLNQSRRQLDSGECVELDGQGLRSLFDDLKRRAVTAEPQNG